MIYSTGNIQITSTKGTASKAQAIVIEGKNNVKITSSTLKCGGISYNNKNDECGVLIYQSMSGDSNEGISTFTSTSSTIEILSTSPSYSIAPMFYITNTETNIKLTSSTLNFGSNIFMKIDEGTWGISGNNGGKAIVTLTCTDVKGNIIVGHTSTLTLYLFGTNFIGTINGENTAQKIEIFVDKNSTITITGNSYVTHLTSQLKNGANLINGTYTWNDGHNIPPSSIPVPWEDDPVSQIPDFLKKLIDDALATLGVEAARNICRKYINEEICKAYLGWDTR